MDGQVTRCPQCGAPVGTGRFCTHCGAALVPAETTALAEPVAPPPSGPGDGSDVGDLGDTATRERVQVAPDDPAPAPPPPDPEPVHKRPLFADDLPAYANPVFAPPLDPEPTYAVPLLADPAPHRRGPGAGLWIGAAVGLVLVLVLGAFLLLSGGGSGDDTASTSPTTLIPPAKHTTAPPTTKAATASPSSTPTSTPTDVANVARTARASAPAHAPAGVDFSGQPVTFVAPNMVHGVVTTCWRTPGDATGMVLTFRLERPTTLTQVGLINGYAKTAFSGGRRYDWYHGDRRILSADWIFDDGSTVSQDFGDSLGMQGITVPPVTTSTVRVRITSVSAPGTGPASRNDTAVSEVGLVGATS